MALLLAVVPLAAGASEPVPASCPPQAQAVSPAEAEAGLRAARDRGFLWRIARDGRVSFLYGTMHIARRDWMFPGPRVVRAIGESDIVALELDMLDAEIQHRLALAMRSAPNERLPDALAARLRFQLQAACLPLAAMAPLAPAVQLAALTTLAARREGLDPAYAVDAFLGGHAHGLGKTVVSLESPEAQIELLAGDPSTALQELEDGLDQLERDRTRPMLLRIAQIWSEGRADELARYEQWCDCADTAAERAALKRLLDDRNPRLADRIDALHASGKRVFAAVGALHMIGAKGLPTLLAQRGYSVQRIEWP